MKCLADYHSDSDTSVEPTLTTTTTITTATPSSIATSPSSKHPKKRRHAYTVAEKIAILKEVKEQTEEVGHTAALESISAFHNIPYTTVEGWLRPKMKSKLLQLSSQKKFNKHKKKIVSKHEGYYPNLERDLVDNIIQERVVGSAIGISWAIEKAKELNEIHQYEEPQFMYHWVNNVLARNNMSLCAIQNTR